MPLIHPSWPLGKLHKLTFESALLRGNALNDPSKRTHYVWTPPSYESDSSRQYPVIYSLAAYGNSGQGAIGWRAFNETVFDRAARLIHQQAIGDVIIAFPDCFTAFGGNQYVNSSAIGRYSDFITQEFVTNIDKHFRTLPLAKHRAVMGKSSGGYGALRLAMDYPNVFGCLASHAGDADFEIVYRPEFPRLLRMLEHYAEDANDYRIDDGRIQRFLAHVWQAQSLNHHEFTALMMLGMAASYDPDPLTSNGFHLPVDIYTGSINNSAWERWLQHDPIVRVFSHKSQLNSLSGIYIDVGRDDEHNLQFGNRHLSKTLERRGIRHHYEEFNGGHRGIDHRFDVSLPFLYECIKPRT